MEINKLQDIILKDFVDSLTQTNNMQETIRFIDWKYQDYNRYEYSAISEVKRKLEEYTHGK